MNRFELKDFRAYVSPTHREKHQIILDIDRSLHSVNQTSSWTKALRYRRREALYNIILAIVSKNDGLYYYQGFHDVVSAFMLVLEDDYLTFAVVDIVCRRYLIDFMQKDLEDVIKLMTAIMSIISMHDEDLYKFLSDSGLHPTFATSWLLTWFSHDMKDINDLARLFDVLLCSDPSYIIYLCAAYLLHFKDDIMQNECDFPTIHQFTTKILPNQYGFPLEDMIALADVMFRKTSPNFVKKMVEPELLELLHYGKLKCFEPITEAVERKPDWKLLSSMNLAPVEKAGRDAVAVGWLKLFFRPNFLPSFGAGGNDNVGKKYMRTVRTHRRKGTITDSVLKTLALSPAQLLNRMTTPMKVHTSSQNGTRKKQLSRLTPSSTQKDRDAFKTPVTRTKYIDSFNMSSSTSNEDDSDNDEDESEGDAVMVNIYTIAIVGIGLGICGLVAGAILNACFSRDMNVMNF